MVVGNSLAGKGHSVPGDDDGHHDYGDSDGHAHNGDGAAGHDDDNGDDLGNPAKPSGWQESPGV